MVGLIPLLLLRPFSPYTLSMPRPLTALSLGSGGVNGFVPLIAGDAEGQLYAPQANAPTPIGRVPGTVLELRCLGDLTFVVAYTRPEGLVKVELWERDGGTSRRSAFLLTLPVGSRPLLAVGPGGLAVGHARGRRAWLFDQRGETQRSVFELAEGLVGLAVRHDDRSGPPALVAAYENGGTEAYGAEGSLLWRRSVPSRGKLLSFEGSGRGDHAAWATDEALCQLEDTSLS
ncbi:hypothetical protein EON82_20890, partial [bacterium]